jgi:hypothetical protein
MAPSCCLSWVGGPRVRAPDRATDLETNLGALHWGMEFAGYGGQKGYARLALGAAPVLFAWPTLALQPMTALIWQWIGFTALWYADSKATLNGWGMSFTSDIVEITDLWCVCSPKVVFSV